MVMNNPESKFWVLLKKHLSGHALRVENTLGRGTPDVHYTSPFGSTWIELKIVENSYFIKVRPEQLVFAHREHLAGGTVHLVAKGIFNEIHVYNFPYFDIRSGNATIDIRNNPGTIVPLTDLDAYLTQLKI
jgi:hypothetical protein